MNPAKTMRVLLVGLLMLAVRGGVARAQGCSGSACSVTSTARLDVPALVELSVAGGGSLTLTPPSVADLATGYVPDAGPAINVRANRTWSLSVHTTAVANWAYAGTQGGAKPIGDLTWSRTANGSFAAITNTAAAVTSNQARTNAGAPTIFFRTVYSADFSADKNAAGTYSIPLVFTLSAP